jgi:hypothetical protein
MQEMTTKGLAQQGPTQTESGVVPIRDSPIQVEVVIVDTLPGTEGINANEAEPRPEDVTCGNASAPQSLRGPYGDLLASGPGSTLLGDASLGDMISDLKSSDIVDPGATVTPQNFEFWNMIIIL